MHVALEWGAFRLYVFKFKWHALGDMNQITLSWMIEIRVLNVEWVQSDNCLSDYWIISIGLETFASDWSMGEM